jgi:hypothetical protein
MIRVNGKAAVTSKSLKEIKINYTTKIKYFLNIKYLI